MRVLVVNAGSSSLKLRVLEPDDQLSASLDLPPADTAGSRDDIRAAVEGMGRVDAVGHRVVHGGPEFRTPVVVDSSVRAQLEALTDLAPIHQPKSLAGLDAVRAVLGGVPHVACFDTAFHADIPPAAATYALKADWRARWDLRRFGFHGLSHAYAARRAAELWAVPPRRPFRLVTCHLGAGASLAAVVDGRSVDTTMGFTPNEGLVMATRSGSVDPGLVLWLQTRGGLTAADVSTGLDDESGLLGLAGTADMRAVIAGVEQGDAPARLALDVYIHRLAAGIASMAVSTGGLDALVFTGGVGEHAPLVRQRAIERTAFLGMTLDPAANTTGPVDREIGAPGGAIRTFVVEAREDLEIARGVRRLLVGRG